MFIGVKTMAKDVKTTWGNGDAGYKVTSKKLKNKIDKEKDKQNEAKQKLIERLKQNAKRAKDNG